MSCPYWYRVPEDSRSLLMSLRVSDGTGRGVDSSYLIGHRSHARPGMDRREDFLQSLISAWVSRALGDQSQGVERFEGPTGSVDAQTRRQLAAFGPGLVGEPFAVEPPA